MLWGIRFHEELNRPDELTGLIRRLQWEPWSQYRAKVVLGGQEWLGWGHEARILADLYDALNYNTAASAVNRKASPPTGKKAYPRPRGVRAKRPTRALPAIDEGVDDI